MNKAKLPHLELLFGMSQVSSSWVRAFVRCLLYDESLSNEIWKDYPPKTSMPFLLSGNSSGIGHGRDSLLIMFTSLAPSPMASVMAFLYLFTRSTTIAFCLGVTRQQMTALHSQAKSTKFFCRCSFLASRRLLLCVRMRRSSSVLGNFSFRILLLLVFFSRRISFCEIRRLQPF